MPICQLSARPERDRLATPSSSIPAACRVGLLIGLFVCHSAVAQNKSQHRIFQFNGSLANTRFGYGVDGAGDVNKDGVPDIVVGADWGSATYRAGSVRVFSGADGKLLHTFFGDAQDDRLGTWVSGAGDANNDGYADVVAGAHLSDQAGANAGMARIFSGKDGKVLYTILGAQAGARFGECVDGGGDVDQDGHADVVIGAPQDGKTVAGKEGSVTVISGKTGAVIWKAFGDTLGDQLGRAVCNVGDINLDGHADFAAGSNIADAPSMVNAGLVRIY